MPEEKGAACVRIPFANHSLYPIRAGVDEEAFILPRKSFHGGLPQSWPGGWSLGLHQAQESFWKHGQNSVCLKHSQTVGQGWRFIHLRNRMIGHSGGSCGRLWCSFLSSLASGFSIGLTKSFSSYLSPS